MLAGKASGTKQRKCAGIDGKGGSKRDENENTTRKNDRVGCDAAYVKVEGGIEAGVQKCGAVSCLAVNGVVRRAPYGNLMQGLVSVDMLNAAHVKVVCTLHKQQSEDLSSSKGGEGGGGGRVADATVLQ